MSDIKDILKLSKNNLFVILFYLEIKKKFLYLIWRKNRKN